MPVVSLSDFFDGLAIVEVTGQIDSDVSSDEDGAGVINRATYGTRLWYGTVALTPLRHAVADEVAAKIQYLEEADVTFNLFLNHLADNTPRNGVMTITESDRRIVNLSEARPSGDIFGVSFGAGKKSMHRVVFNTGSLTHTVVPPIPFGAGGGATVTFDRPEIEAVLVKADLPTYRAKLAFGTSFQWRQTH